MNQSIQALRNLQEIDRKIFRVEAELKRLPAELSRRSDELNEHARRLEEVRARITILRREAKEIEDYTTGMRQRGRKLENESNAQKIDAAMLASFEVEIRNLKRNIGQAEDDALRKMGQCEELEREAGELESLLRTEKTAFDEFRANVQTEVAAAEEEHKLLMSDRDTRSAEDVDPAQLDLYRRLLEQREGEALAELADGHCQSCFVQIPKNLGVRLMRGQLVQCPSCDRILYSTF